MQQKICCIEVLITLLDLYQNYATKAISCSQRDQNRRYTHWVSHQFQLHIGAWHEVKVLVPIHQHHSVPGSTLLVEKDTMVIAA